MWQRWWGLGVTPGGADEPPRSPLLILGYAGAAGFLVTGFATLALLMVLPLDHRPAAAVLATIAVVAGLVFTRLPWDRLGRPSLLAVPLLAWTLLAVPVHGNDVASLVALDLLVFAYLGLTQSTGIVARVAPFSLVAALVHVALARGSGDDVLVPLLVAGSTWAVATAVAVLIAEIGQRRAVAVRRADLVFTGLRSLLDARGERQVPAALNGALQAVLDADVVLTFVRQTGRRDLVLAAGHEAEVGAGDEADADRWTDLPELTVQSDGEGEPVPADRVLGAETVARLVPTLRSGRTLFAPERAHNLIFEEAPPPLADMASVMVVPVSVEDGQDPSGNKEPELGFIVVGWRRPVSALDPLVDSALDLLLSEARHVFERELRVEQMNRDARTDGLTGLLNRRAIEQEIAGLEAGDVVALIDLDHLRRVNEREGHAAGDRTLRTLAACLVDFCRRNDWCGRLGEEEFLLVVRKSAAQPSKALDRLRQRWRSLQPATTFSAGVAVHRTGASAWETVTHADAALRRAKELGRDRVEVYERSRTGH
jgi:diguanylate cyclase (GGDEF)-like protein